MKPEAIAALLNGIGSATLLFVATIAAIRTRIARRQIDKVAQAQIRFDVSAPFDTLSAEERKERGDRLFMNSLAKRLDELHHDFRKRGLIEEVTESAPLSVLGFLGSCLLVIAYFIEAFG